MDKQEFLPLIPGIVYGVAIVNLLKIVQHKVNYWEEVFWGVLLLTTIINHWMELYKKLEKIWVRTVIGLYYVALTIVLVFINT